MINEPFVSLAQTFNRLAASTHEGIENGSRAQNHIIFLIFCGSRSVQGSYAGRVMQTTAS